MTNGDDAEFGEFPWTVAIMDGDRLICGGSLIHPKVVLTTFHNVAKCEFQLLIIIKEKKTLFWY